MFDLSTEDYWMILKQCYSQDMAKRGLSHTNLSQIKYMLYTVMLAEVSFEAFEQTEELHMFSETLYYVHVKLA